MAITFVVHGRTMVYNVFETFPKGIDEIKQHIFYLQLQGILLGRCARNIAFLTNFYRLVSDRVIDMVKWNKLYYPSMDRSISLHEVMHIPCSIRVQDYNTDGFGILNQTTKHFGSSTCSYNYVR